MNNPEKRFIVDFGGGPDWQPGLGHGGPVMDSINNLRATKLAKENPTVNYVVLDMQIPRPEAQLFHKGYPNLHFIEHKMGQPVLFPFADNSVDRIEINHMWSALANEPEEYVHALRESSRILKPRGVLAITEQRDNIGIICDVLHEHSFLDLDPTTQVTRPVTGPHRSYYSQLSFPNDVLYSYSLKKK